MKKETIYKLKLIKKYAKIRFKRWWKEWGINDNEELEMFIGALSVFIIPFLLCILGCMF